MELAKITSKGQITLPISIRKMLNLKDGDKVAFIEKNGQYIVVNPVSLAIDNARDAFKGEAERLNLKNEEDVVNLVKEVRKEIKKENSMFPRESQSYPPPSSGAPAAPAYRKHSAVSRQQYQNTFCPA